MDEESSIHQTSPTPNEAYSGINVIESDEFTIDKVYLKKDFLSPENKQYCDWFMKIDKPVRELWYAEMNKLKVNIPYFTWFHCYLNSQDFVNPFDMKAIEVQTRLTKTWNLIPSGTVNSVHPPLQGIIINTPDEEVKAEPFKKGGKDSDSSSTNLRDIKKIYEQNNYSNQILHTIATQVDTLHTQVENSTKPSFPRSVSRPHFQVSKLPKNLRETISLTPPKLIDRITEQLKVL